nr:diphthamide biosynthesis protein 1 [Cryptomonas curvata]
MLTCKIWCLIKLSNFKMFIYKFFEKIFKKKFLHSLLSDKILKIQKNEIRKLNYGEHKITTKYLKKIFPFNYNFECEKISFRLNNFKIRKIILQFPEGLQKYVILLDNVLKNTCLNSKIFLISSRTTFGACCAEDFLGKFTGICVVLHYGHSCLFPILECILPMMYIFLEIKFDYNFVINIIKENVTLSKLTFILFSTIQFASLLKNIKSNLDSSQNSIYVLPNKPLSPGEVLGCTCLRLNSISNIIFVGEGRFHLEATIISNPFCRFFQFNPFSQHFTVTDFNTIGIYNQRRKEILNSFLKKINIGIIIGSLGRQGNYSIIKKMQELIKKKNFESILISTTEISSDVLEIIGYKIIETWTQVVCPRLSIDWGSVFGRPLLNTYEFGILFSFTRWKLNKYPLDYYSYLGGFWANYFYTKSIYSIKTNC